MTKISSLFLAGILFIAACNNEGSSTVGTYEREESSTSSEKKEESHEEKYKNENAAHVSDDTVKSMDSSLNKKDTATLMNKNKVKAH